jgi:hypothetical protein
LNKRKASCALSIIAAFGAAWLFLGQVTYTYDDGSQHHVFIKQHPTLQVLFVNPYASDFLGEERDYSKKFDVSGRFLSTTPEFGAFLNYCKYRFGVMGDDMAAHDRCVALTQGKVASSAG